MFTHLGFLGVVLLVASSAGVNICHDINDHSSDLVSRNEFKALFTSTESVRPYGDVRIVEVFEENVTLWESDNDAEECTFIVIFRFEELVTLVFLKISTGEGEYKLHYVKQNGVWELMESDEFRTVLDEMKAKIPTENHILLDIQNPDEQKITVRRRNTGGADFVTFTTNHPYSTIKITDGKSAIWRGTYNQDCCIDCAVYLKKENFELLQAFLCSDNNTGFRFFTKAGGKWTVLEEGKFYEQLKALDIEEDDRFLSECMANACR